MYLGIDIGGSAIKFAYFDDEFNIIRNKSCPTPTDTLENLLIALKENTQDVEALKGVGIACPGTVNHDDEKVYFGGALRYLHNVNLKQECESIFKTEVVIENDGKAATLGEMSFGNLNGIRFGMAIILGSGVGGGLVIDSKLVSGKNYFAGEFSFMSDDGVFNMDQYQSMFGYKGSAVVMVNTIAQQLGIEANGIEVFKHINNGHEEAVAIFEKYCKSIAEKIVNLNYVLDVEKIVIGGGISEQDIVVSTIKRYVETLIPSYLFKSPEVVKCKLGSKANLYGAIVPFIK